MASTNPLSRFFVAEGGGATARLAIACTLVGLLLLILSAVLPSRQTTNSSWGIPSVHQTFGFGTSSTIGTTCSCNCSKSSGEGPPPVASALPSTVASMLPSSSNVASPSKIASPSSIPSSSSLPSSSPTSLPRPRRHAILVGGQVRAMSICLKLQVERFRVGQPGVHIDVFAHLGPTTANFVPASYAGNISGYDLDAVQWLCGITSHIVFEDLDFSDAKLVNMPEDARSAIPSWPFACEYADNPTPNVIASFYRRWRLLQMAEAEERAGNFTYETLTLLRPDTCPCMNDTIDLDKVFPPRGVEPPFNQPVKVYTAQPPSGGGKEDAEINIIHTPGQYGLRYHASYLDVQIDDASVSGPREVVAWYLSVFPFSEILSGQLHLRYHPETADKNALIHGLQKKARDTNRMQILHVIPSPILRYCLMRYPLQCDPFCTLHYLD